MLPTIVTVLTFRPTKSNGRVKRRRSSGRVRWRASFAGSEREDTVAHVSREVEAESVGCAMTPRAYEHAYEQGWTDGLPIIPAVPENVKQFVAASGPQPMRYRGHNASSRSRRRSRRLQSTPDGWLSAGVHAVVIAAIEAITDPAVSAGADAGQHQCDDGRSCSLTASAAHALTQFRHRLPGTAAGAGNATIGRAFASS